MTTQEENQKKILEWIEDDFNICIDNYRTIINPSEGETISSGSDDIESFSDIVQAIRNYVREHSNDFFLGGTRGDWEDGVVYDKIHESDLKGNASARTKRPWWSPLILTTTRRMAEGLGYYRPPSGGANKQVMGAKTRKIKHINGSFIHPAALTEQEYEEIKNSLSSNVSCKIAGCCSLLGFNPVDGFPGPIGKSGYEVRDNVCDFHRLYPDYWYAKLGVGGDESNTTQPRKESLKVKFDQILWGYVGNPHYAILSHPLTLRDVSIPIYYISIFSDSSLLVENEEIIIKDISFGPGQARVDENSHEIKIGRFFGTIEKVATTPPPLPNPDTTNTNPPQTSPPPTNPTSPTVFLEVQQKNLEIQAENTDLALLAAQLLEIIDKNNKFCVQAKNEKGLNLIAMLEPDGSPMQLNNFNTSLEELKLNQSLNSPDNQRILTKNAKNKQLKEDFAKSLKIIWQQNQTKWQQAQNSGGNIPEQNSESSLADKKTTAIFQIESKQVDLTTVAGGSYANYRQTIEGFSKEAEVENYLNEVLTAIAQTKQEKENSQSDKKNPRPLLSEDEKLILSSSLEEAKKRSIAEIKNFLTSLGVKESDLDFEIQFKIGTVYEKAKASTYFQIFSRLNNKLEILELTKNLKRDIAQRAAEKENNQCNQSHNSLERQWLTPLLIGSLLVFAALVAAALVVKGRKIRHKKITRL